MTRLQSTFLALVAAQSAHSLEEYLGRLWEVFPPATFLTGLVAEDREVGFVIINLAVVAFGVWCFLWPVRCRWPSAQPLMGAWILIEILNGLGHLLWSIRQGGYTPGVITAPLLLTLAVLLLWQMRRAPKFHSQVLKDGPSKKTG